MHSLTRAFLVFKAFIVAISRWILVLRAGAPSSHSLAFSPTAGLFLIVVSSPLRFAGEVTVAQLSVADGGYKTLTLCGDSKIKGNKIPNMRQRESEQEEKHSTFMLDSLIELALKRMWIYLLITLVFKK